MGDVRQRRALREAGSVLDPRSVRRAQLSGSKDGGSRQGGT